MNAAAIYLILQGRRLNAEQAYWFDVHLLCLTGVFVASACILVYLFVKD